MDDLISRQAALDAINSGMLTDDDTQFECPSECNSMLEWAVNAVKELPTAEPDAATCWGCNCPKMPDAEKRGEWKVLCHGQQDNGLYVFSYTCSECGFHGDNTNYCPNCGARMEE